MLILSATYPYSKTKTEKILDKTKLDNHNIKS
jgi:hypothetical protein